jgi:hypothetical protein
VLFMASIATFVQSYLALKIALLTVFLVVWTIRLYSTHHVVIHRGLLTFYLWTSLAGIIWAIVGLLRPGTYVVGITDSVRLYVIWSAAYLILFTLLRSEPSLRLVHFALVVAGIVIAIINLAGVADQLAGTGAIPEAVRQELELYVGIHDGYIQITSNNIGALFVIIPYLLTLQFRADAAPINTVFTKIALGLTVFVAAISGRRGLWLVVAMTPCLILAWATATSSLGNLRQAWRRTLYIYTGGAALLAGTASVLPASVRQIGYVSHLESAFSSQDERSIQRQYLLDAFAESPAVGSGFGAYAGYLRNEERPWTYELTYHQLLFNVGLVGFVMIGGLFCSYLMRVTVLIARFDNTSCIPFALLLAISGLLVGSYGNPYLKSFDYLFFVGLLPYLSTFRSGFAEDRPVLRALS